MTPHVIRLAFLVVLPVAFFALGSGRSDCANSAVAAPVQTMRQCPR